MAGEHGPPLDCKQQWFLSRILLRQQASVLKSRSAYYQAVDIVTWCHMCLSFISVIQVRFFSGWRCVIPHSRLWVADLMSRVTSLLRGICHSHQSNHTVCAQRLHTPDNALKPGIPISCVMNISTNQVGTSRKDQHGHGSTDNSANDEAGGDTYIHLVCVMLDRWAVFPRGCTMSGHLIRNWDKPRRITFSSSMSARSCHNVIGRLYDNLTRSGKTFGHNAPNGTEALPRNGRWKMFNERKPSCKAQDRL